MIAYAARRARLDLVHDPTGVCPFTLPAAWGTFRRVVTIHDAIAFRFPNGYPVLNNFLQRRYLPMTLRNTDAVITVSDFARNDLSHFLGVGPERLHVVPNGVSKAFRPVDRETADAGRRDTACTALHAHGGPSASEKESPGAYRSGRCLGPSIVPHRLALVGPPMWDDSGIADMIHRHALEDRIVATGYVQDEDLPSIYSGADFLVFPSLHEDFGLPMIESMACGAPVDRRTLRLFLRSQEEPPSWSMRLILAVSCRDRTHRK